MRKFYFLLLTILFAATISNAQNVTVNPGAGSYPDLASAFTAINAGTHTGAITIDIVGNTTETVSAVLNASGTGAASYTSIIISPSGGAARTISGAIAGHLIDLNGADNVTIDGLNTGGNSLTIDNTTSGASSTTIRLIADASNNIIQKCTIKGAGTSATLGTVFFSTGTVTGNDGNNINNCDITSSGANFATNAVYSAGTSAAIDNSGNTLNANNISDYFIATGSASIGIFLAATGNSAWTISNNKLFQTATRIYTSSQAGLCGISIQSGEAYTITGNIIGFANSSGTGTTKIVGNSVALTGTFPSSYTTTGTANATRYIAISCAFTAGGAVSSIQNNTIAGFALYTSSGATTTNGILCGINVTSGNANIGTVTGNTIGSTSGNGSIYTATTTSGGVVVGIYATSTNTISIQNNTIGAIEAMGTTATISGGITGINSAGTGGNFTVSNNTIGNSTNPNLRMGNLTTGANLSNVGTTFGIASGLGTFNGILNSATGTVTISNNTIRNASHNTTSSSTSSSIRGITASGSPLISDNQINNLTSQSANTGLSSTLLAAMGIFMNSISTNGAIVTRNVIHTISLANTTTSGTNLAGIAGYSGTTEYSMNRIYNLSNASTSTTTTAPGTVSGIFFRQPGGTQTVVNNMISLGNAQTTNTSFIGVWQQNSAVAYTLNCYFNSINIEGAAASGAQPSFGLYRGSFTTTQVTIAVDIRNNIFVNNRSGGTGPHFAIANNYAATVTATGWGANASNYNILNANASTIGWWSANQTFAGWKAASASDASSVSGATVIFTNTATGDLHMNFGVTPNQIESGGVTGTGITIDYDNQTRPGPPGSVNGGGLAPDIGADEFDGVFLDLLPPIITYTSLPNTLCTSNQTLSATITDLSGVNTAAGTKPRLYFKKSTDADTYAGNTSADNGWKYVEASNASSPFSFTTNYSLLQSAVTAGDVIQYFVVAQDLASTPNVGINSGTFAAAPSSVALTAGAFPLSGTINSYNVVAGGLSGIVTIGAAGTYTSLTGAGGLFAAINSSGLIGNVTANIIDASVAETGANALNAILYGCGGPYTLLIKPNTTSTLTGSVASGALIKLNGASNVTIDGSNSGSTDQSLTITNSNTTAPTAISLSSLGIGLGASNNTIKNCIINTGVATSIGYGISVGGSTPGTSGADNDNVTIQNNNITVAPVGIYANGTASVSTGGDDNLMINGNTIGYNGTLASLGIQVGNSLNSSVTQNTVTEETTAAQAPTAISLETGFVSSSVTRNIITKSLTTNTGGYGGRGITVGTGTASSNLTIANNFIAGVNGTNWSSFSNSSAIGIAVGTIGSSSTLTTTAGGVNIYHNSVNITGSMGTGSTAAITTAIYLGSGASGLDIRNNIFANTQVGTNTNQKNYAIYSAVANSAFTSINYNDYFVSNSFNAPSAIIGFLGSDQSTLAAWRTASGQDLQSQNVAPVFTSNTDLHLVNTVATNWCLNGTGVTIPAITIDIDNQSRGTPPDIGADEFTAASSAAATPASQTVCSGTAITTIVLSGTATSFNWTRDNTGTVTGIAASGSGDISGTLTNTTTSPVTVTFTITPLDASGCAGPTFTATVLVNPTPDAVATPASQTICSGASITTIVLSGAVSGTTFNWTRDNTGTVTGIAASGSGNISGSLTNTTASPVTVTFTITPTANGCNGTPITATVIVNAPLLITGNPSNISVCSGTSVTFTVTASGTPAPTYQWQVNNGGGFVNIGGATSSSYSFTATNAENGYQYQCVVTNSCGTATSTAATLTVSAAASATISYAGNPYCSNAGIVPVTLTGTAGGTFSSTPGLSINAATGAVNTGTSTPGTYTVSYDIAASGSCPAFSTTTQITINLTPTVNPVADQTVCNGANTAPVNFSGTPAGVVFNWTNNDPSIGLAASGSGNIASFNAVNAGTTAVVSTITVTPSYAYTGVTCTGTPITFTITVNPSPTVNAVSNQTVCNGSPTTAVNFSGAVAGTVYSWTNNNTSIGLGASGTGDIPSFTATNSGLVAVVATITVTLTYTNNGVTCTGASTTFTITVNPTPTVNAVSNQTVCNGSPTTAVNFSGAVAGTVYNWTNNNTSIGLGASGTGDIPSFTATNPGLVSVVATITVTPTYTNNGVTCTGASTTFTITVNPTPTVNPVPNISVCHNAPSAPVVFSGAVAATIFQWTNNTPSIGLPASGTGNIPSFIAFNPGPGPVTATITVTPTTNSNFFSQTFNFTGAVQTWVVPAGVTSVDIQAFGAQGNRNAFSVAGGLGGSASGTLAVAPGNTLYIMVGGGNVSTASGGFNGGGAAGSVGCATARGGGGGGASDVRLNVNALANRVIVAAGGGGAGGNRVAGCGRGNGGGGGGGYYGGGGGAGWPGIPPGGPVPTGGTQVAGGAGGITTFPFGPTNGFPGSLGQGGAGGTEVTSFQGGSATAEPGGIGGGLIGGSGLYNPTNNWCGQSGAGGSSYIGGVSSGITSSGVRSGNGAVTISYTLAGVPVICTGIPTTFTITVNPPPTISCPANITVNSQPGLCGAAVLFPPATAIGAPTPVITYSHFSGAVFPVGTTTVTATATNSCGTASCTFTITVLDVEPPVITCPAPIVVSNDPNQCGAVVNYSVGVADNCQKFRVPVNILGHGAGAITVAGNNQPGGFYFDLTNNSATPKTIKSFMVRFGSSAFGAVSSPAPVSVYVTTSATTYVGNQTTAGAWTAIGANIPVTVGGSNSEFSLVPLPGNGFTLAPGETKGVYLMGTAASLLYNNAANSSFTPVSNGVLTLTPGQASSGLFVAAASPRVPNVIINYITLTQTAGLPSGSFFPVGITTNTFTATDDAGNTSASCSFTVRVNDTQAPTITCPANITVTTPVGSCTAVVNYTVTASDNCPGVITQLVSGLASGSAFPIGVNTVTWRAVDAAGNLSPTCSFTVTVLDAQLPVISQQPVDVSVCAGENASFSVTSTNAVSYQWQVFDGNNWNNIPGATSSTLTLSNVTITMNAGLYRVRVIGLCTTVNSAAATLYVKPMPTIVLTASRPPILLPGQFLTITAVVNPAGGTFVWRKNGSVIAGATTNQLTGLTVDDAGSYTCTYTLNGCTVTSAVMIVSAQESGNIYVYPNPNFGQFEVRFYNQNNEQVTLTVFNVLGQVIYQRAYATGLPYSHMQVSLGNVPQGSYLVAVINRAGQIIGAKWITVYH